MIDFVYMDLDRKIEGLREELLDQKPFLFKSDKRVTLEFDFWTSASDLFFFFWCFEYLINFDEQPP